MRKDSKGVITNLSPESEHRENSGSRDVELDAILKERRLVMLSFLKDEKQRTLISFNCKYLSSFTASASNAAWKNETV